ncbi:nuclear transport factor 2 family protein [Plantactinospora siamensis]|uniref:Nuclear transport factor 2 family protein n=1 Tax=Plantactinospora siamensis TaxID=555372 RepID=A0ABV6NQT4_9ACTN
MSNADVVRAAFEAYRQEDRAAAEPLYGPELRFTSPQDDHIDRAAFFERCFPTASRFRTWRLLHVAEADDRDVYATYEYELPDGDTHRNTELITVEDGRIVEVQVFFGGRYDGAS